jgi:hypothetical protein
MKRYIYITITFFVLIGMIAIYPSQRGVNGKQRNNERQEFFVARHPHMNSDMSSQQPVDISIIRLIADPATYDGKYIRVIGFVSIEFERTAVYLNQADHNNFISKNAVWLDIAKGDQRNYKNSDQKYAIVEGTFDAKYNGHLGGFSGSIKKIKRLEIQ